MASTLPGRGDAHSLGTSAFRAAWTQVWGLTALLALAFGSLVSPSLVALGMVMALAALVVIGHEGLRDWASAPPVALGLVLALWVAVRALANALGASSYEVAIRADDVSAYLRIAGPLSALFGLFLAWRPRYRYWVLSAFVLSWLIYLGSGFNLEHLLHALDGNRLRFGYSPTELAMLGGGACMAGLGCLLHALFARDGQRWAMVTLGVVGFAGMTTGAAGVLLSLTRSAWLGFAAVLPLVVIGWVITGLRRSFLRKTWIFLLGLTLLVAMALTGWAVKDTISERFARDWGTVEAMLSGNEAEIPFRSWGKRYFMYTEGAAMVAERPLAGYGPGTIRNIRKHYESERLYGAGHFHSFTVTSSVALGVVWTALWLGLAGMLLWQGVRGLVGALDDPHFAWAAAGFFGFYLATSQFQVRMFQSTGSAYLMLAMALLFAGVFLHRWGRPQDEKDPS